MKALTKYSLSGMLITCLIAASPASKAEVFREYETADGRMISGMLIEFDAETEEVVFLRGEDRQLLQANLTAFSETERTFIRDWAVAKQFLNGLDISATLQWEKNKSLSNEKRLVQTVGYDILLHSTTGYPFGEIQVHYCIYYRQGKVRGKKMKFDRGVCRGDGVVKLETVQQKDTLETETISLYFLRSAYTLFGAGNDVEGAVSGIWIRAIVTLPSGHVCSREYRSSLDADWKWASRSIPAGLNKTAEQERASDDR